MVIQELTPQSATPLPKPIQGFAAQAIAPARHFASAFSSSSAGFAPTSILIELFGALAHPQAASQIASGILLGLAGLEQPQPGEAISVEAPALLDSIHINKSLRLNRAIEVPYISSEHLMLHPTGLTPIHPDGFRLTAYHCVHPFVTRQFYASASPNPPTHACGTTLSFIEC